MVEFIKLGSLVDIRTGKLNANAANENGCYPFFTCSVEPLTINTYAYDCESVLIAGNGDLNVKYYNGKFNAYQRTYIIESKDKDILSVRFLYYFLCEYIDTLRNNSIGGVIKYIKLSDLTDINFPLIPIKEQQRIVKILDNAEEIRTKKKLANEKLDEFIKSMFLIYYKKGIQERKLEELCEFITKGTTPKKHDMSQGEGDIPYIKVYNLLYDTKLDFSINPTFITKKAHKQELARSIVYPNDVLMNIVGPPLGKVSIVPNIFPEWNINQAIVRFRCKTELNYRYLAWFLTTPYAMKQMIKSAKKTSGQLNLTLDICRKLLIPIPPIDLQNQFAQIVQKVEAQKGKNQKVIEQMDNLFNSLMQQAFNSSL